MSKSVTVKVPGKLFIAGEYSVTKPGGLAMIVAIETDFSVKISENQGKSVLKTNVNMTDYEFSMTNITIEQNNPWNFVLAVLKKLNLPSNQEIMLEIQSDLGFEDNKKGYGSSASVVAGVVEAANEFFELNLGFQEQFQIAGNAHREIQGSGSMGDVAAILAGGFSFYRNSDVTENAKIPWETYVISTGKSVKTDEKLQISLSDEFYDRSNEIVTKLRNVVKFDEFKSLLLQNQKLLIENLPAEYVTEKLDFALKTVNAQENMVGKISGSGFGENLIVFVKSDEDIKKVRQILEKKDLKLEKLMIAEEKL